ncbi:MAG: putative immunity protein, partial [Pseudothermotoga sp.]
MIIDLNDVRVRWKKKNKLLFSRDSLCLQELAKLVALEEHKTVVLWALDCAKLPLKEIETRYPGEHRPRRCLELCEAWAKGQIRMPVTRSAILDLHALAREIREERYSLLCRA